MLTHLFIGRHGNRIQVLTLYQSWWHTYHIKQYIVWLQILITILIIYFSTEIHFHYRWVTDCLNMLQGIYIFVIFVLKRNVISAIKEKFGGRNRKMSKMTIVSRGGTKMTRKTSNQRTSVLSTTLGSEAPSSKPFA